MTDDKEASDRRKLVSKWHPTTKGTLKRNYRVPSRAEGCRLLKAIASLLSDDDHFVDATSHKVNLLHGILFLYKSSYDMLLCVVPVILFSPLSVTARKQAICEHSVSL